MECIPIKDIRGGMKNINVIFIILEVQSATRTKENREVFSYKVADPTACINCSIWDEPGKLLIPGDIVKLTKGYASIWKFGSLTLYSGKNGEIIKMGDFCMVFNEQLNMSEPLPAVSQSQPQGNHASSTTSNGGNGNGRSTNPASGSGTSNNGNKAKSSSNAPSKSYVRKPLNKNK